MDNLISVYTRQQAIKDGIFVDVSKVAKQAGFSIPVAITTNLYNSHIKQSTNEDTQFILKNFLAYMSKVVRNNKGDNTLIPASFNFHPSTITSTIKGVKPEITVVWIAIEAQSPTDNSLACNILLPEDY